MAYVIDGNKKYIPPKSTKVNFNENIFYDYEWDKTRVPKVDLLDELGYKQYEFNVNGKDLGSIMPLLLGGLGIITLISILKR